MDVIKAKKTTFYKKKSVLITGVISVTLLFTILLSQFRISAHGVESGILVTDTVKYGGFSINVSGPGVLVPKDVRIVASTVAGRVEQIFQRPGAEVEEGQVIVKLVNTELQQQIEELSWEVEAMEKETAALKERQNTQLVEMEAQKLRSEMDYKVERMLFHAEKDLLEKGNGTVSSIDFRTREMNVERLKSTLKLEELLLAQLKKNLEAEYAAQMARVNGQKKSLERIRYQHDSLEVKAPISGILQSLPLELGQQLDIGANIARIAKQDDLIAVLQIPELNASMVAIGQRALIDTRVNQIKGKIVRIDPAVTNGTVLVEVELEQGLPEEARPDLSINGEVFIDEKPKALFVRRPAFSKANQKMTVYKIDQSKQLAEKVDVAFGVASSLDIEVLSGLQAGDKIIVSETTDFDSYQSITLL
jgi:HlyD family secretion protein